MFGVGKRQKPAEELPPPSADFNPDQFKLDCANDAALTLGGNKYFVTGVLAGVGGSAMIPRSMIIHLRAAPFMLLGLAVRLLSFPPLAAPSPCSGFFLRARRWLLNVASLASEFPLLTARRGWAGRPRRLLRHQRAVQRADRSQNGRLHGGTR